MLALVFAKMLFDEVVFAPEMVLISASKSGPCGVAPPVATGPPGVARVGKHRAKFSLAHRRAGMLGASSNDVPTK